MQMRRYWKRIIWTVVVLALVGWASLPGTRRVQKVFPPNVRAVLEHSDRFELAAIDAVGQNDGTGQNVPAHRDRIQGYTVRKRVVIRNGWTRARILGSLYSAVQLSSGDQYACFQPHHAIVAKRGKETVSLVICFECGEIDTDLNGNSVGGDSITNGPDALLNDLLKAQPSQQ